MKETIKKTTTTTTFADALKAYNADPANADALTAVAMATTYAVLKKVINVTSNPTLVTIRRELTRDRADLDRLAWANDNATRLAFTGNGDLVTEVVDQRLVDESARLAGLPLGDGLDLVHDAVAAILEETAAQMERDPGMPTDLERPYETRRLKRKVYIKSTESAGAWETVETSPIREVYKAVRRSIDASRAAQTDPRNGYTYLEDLAIDSESGEQATVYRRLPKYADLGGRVCDYNGAETVPTTAAAADVEETDRIVAALNLTDRQATILMYRMRGYGYKAIATAMGVSRDNITGQMKEIRRKWLVAGLKDPAAK